jgi:hypothetical protein
MVKDSFSWLLIILAINFAFIGCTKDLDFNQANDFEVSPALESSLIFFDAPASDFFIDGNEVTTVQDFVDIDIFNSTFINDHLIKAEFVLEAINSVNRAYSLRIDFLNGLDQLQHTFSVMAPASPASNDVLILHTEVFEGASLGALKNTSKLVFTLTMLPGPPINDNTLGRIHLESKGVLYFNYTR